MVVVSWFCIDDIKLIKSYFCLLDCYKVTLVDVIRFLVKNVDRIASGKNSIEKGINNY